ncbi:hypothetical protein FJW06_19710 [Mesorhizobium sp. B4-1-3]|nr:hypothetical protein FJW06_19710 [Mesorhizobium sp. B4-1-3]
MSVTQIGGERCPTECPYDLEALAPYKAVVISDVGALRACWSHPRRGSAVSASIASTSLKADVEAGGGLMLAGGYMGFQGMFGTARFHDTPVEDVLPARPLRVLSHRSLGSNTSAMASKKSPRECN